MCTLYIGNAKYIVFSDLIVIHIIGTPIKTHLLQDFLFVCLFVFYFVTNQYKIIMNFKLVIHVTVFCMVIEYKLLTCEVTNRMLWSYGMDAHRRLSRSLTRPSTCYKAQYVHNVVSSLYQSRRVRVGLILLFVFMGLAPRNQSTF